jgi:hypothetical protein
MSRTREIYQSDAIAVGATGGGAAIQITRSQTVNYNIGVTRRDVNQLGQLAAIDRLILEPPTANIDFSYLESNKLNADAIGLYTDGDKSVITYLLDKSKDCLNYYVAIAPEGKDAIDNPVWAGVVGIGNGYISSYSAEGAVGGFPTASVNVQGMNATFGLTGPVNPTVNPVDGTTLGAGNSLPSFTSGAAQQATALQPGDVSLTITSDPLGISFTDAKVQSYNFSVDLNRTPLQKLGSKFPFSREITFPVQATCRLEMHMGDTATGNLANILCNDAPVNITVLVRKPACPPTVGATGIWYTLKNAKLDSSNWSMSIGPNKTATLQYTAQVGASGDTTNGLFMGGAAT